MNQTDHALQEVTRLRLLAAALEQQAAQGRMFA
jgi:hypothetical protein